MALFLQIVGAIVVAVVLLVLFAFLWLRAKLKKIAKELQGLADAIPQPARVNLRKVSDDAWSHAAVAESAEEFRRLGYLKGPAYQPQEIEALTILPLVNPSVNAYGAIYNLSDGGKVWCDVYQHYDDGSITISNSTHTHGLRQRPGYENTYLPGQSVQDLHERFLQDRRESGAKTATLEAFKYEFEEAYAAETAWRDATGVSAAEIAKIAHGSDIVLTEDQLALSLQTVTRQGNNRLAERLREQFLKETTLTAAEWDDVEERVVFVHDRLTPEEVEEIGLMVGAEGDFEMPVGTPRAAFHEFNEGLADNKKFRSLGSISWPIESDVYVAPEVFDDVD